MSFEVMTSEQAAADTTGIVEYIAQRNPDAAERIRQGIINQIDLLHLNPFVGDIVKRVPEGILREWQYRNFRIYFTIDEEARRVTVIRILHARRQDPDFLE